MEVWVCRREELRPGIVRTAKLGHDDQGLPIMALLLLDDRGAIVAYRNLCRHLPMPLDGGTGKLLSEDGAHLVCGTHGATYRLRDGYCVDGPCEGLTLHRLRVREDGGDLYVSDRAKVRSK
ncbi:MAG: Rieske 2Fe-2S domain-containing protein [Myxococcales bacterium]|nr:Rieske 2Fe-2S domain-containing protein [Myxococcales bacterium]